MKSYSKTTTTIALFLISAFAISLVAVPAANAHTPPWDIPTYAYINVAPNPVGVGQQVNILMWLDKTFAPEIALTNDYRFHNYNLTIVNDDTGAIAFSKIYETVIDTTSSQYQAWTPDTTGTYTLYFSFPGQDFNEYSHPTVDSRGRPEQFVNDTYLKSSAQTTLVVQDEQIPTPITSYPLPAEYWTRPIYGENTDWWSISSNWLGTGSPGFTVWSSSSLNRYPGDAVGPLTPHIMWTKALQEGGVVGGTINTRPDLNGNTWFEGSAYNQRYGNPIIVSGMLIYNPPVSYTGVSSGPTTCVDLRTGEVLWSRSDVPAPSFAYVYDVEDPQQHGVYPAILFTSNFGSAYDAYTGDHLFNVRNVPGGASFFGPGAATVLGPQGEHLRYVWTNTAPRGSAPDWTLGEWNSTLLWTGEGFAVPDSGGLSPNPDLSDVTTWAWQNTTTYVDGVPTVTSKNVTTTTTSVDASVSSGPHTRYDWIISEPTYTSSSAPSPVGAIYGDMIIYENGTLPGLTTSVFGTNSYAPYTYFAVNLNASRPGYDVGDILWTNEVDAPPGNVSVSLGSVDPVNHVFFEAYKETMQFVGYSMEDGHYLWTTPTQTALDYYGNPALPYVNGQIAYGKLYSVQYGGILYCYDTATGDLLWTYGNGGPGNSTNAGLYLAYGHYPTFINAVGNGVLYTVTTEHTVNTPIYKGALARAINATDGTEIWTLSDYTGEFFTMSYAIADGFATWFNGYDNQIYSIGRGPSATTVSAPDTAAAFGTPVVIKGTVLDVSAGTQQNEQAARFPYGVPAVSDASMSEWMGYIYQQKPRPTNATGVTVTLSVVDANNNCREIGTTTTDMDGFFSFQWTPDIPGKYTVIASFAGSSGYWPSHAESAFTVMPEPEATPTPPTQPTSNTDMYVTGFGIAIIAAIAVVGVLLLRKH
jgi:outer membrane protein assembly factor BamB